MIFREVDRKVLDPAMKHALNVHTETAEFLFASISQRLAEQIRERIEEHPPISADEGEDAQAELLSTLIDWSEEERFAFKPLTEGA
jgi:flagellar motor switch protein FliG